MSLQSDCRISLRRSVLSGRKNSSSGPKSWASGRRAQKGLRGTQLTLKQFAWGATSSALLDGLRSMLASMNLPTGRPPSPQIRTRDTPLDGAANGSAGVNSAPDVDAGVNSASDLGGQRCGGYEDRGDGADYRKLAEHKTATCPVHFQQPCFAVCTIEQAWHEDARILRL